MNQIPDDPTRTRFSRKSTLKTLANSNRVHVILVDASQSMEKPVEQHNSGYVQFLEQTRLQKAKESVNAILRDPQFTRVVYCFDEQLINEDYRQVVAFGYTNIEKCLLELADLLRRTKRKFLKLHITILTDAEDEEFQDVQVVKSRLRLVSEGEVEGQLIFIGSDLPGASETQGARKSLEELFDTRGLLASNGDAQHGVETLNQFKEEVKELETQVQENETQAEALGQQIADTLLQPLAVQHDIEEKMSILQQTRDVLTENILKTEIALDNDDEDTTVELNRDKLVSSKVEEKYPKLHELLKNGAKPFDFSSDMPDIVEIFNVKSCKQLAKLDDETLSEMRKKFGWGQRQFRKFKRLVGNEKKRQKEVADRAKKQAQERANAQIEIAMVELMQNPTQAVEQAVDECEEEINNLRSRLNLTGSMDDTMAAMGNEFASMSYD